jgi:nicotinamidase-related amidase
LFFESRMKPPDLLQSVLAGHKGVRSHSMEIGQQRELSMSGIENGWGRVMEILDIDRSIVLVIDMQGKLVEAVEQSAQVIAATTRLLKICDLFGAPVLLTEQYPQGLGVTHPEIRAAYDALKGPRRYLVKTSFGCGGDENFERFLAELRPGIEPRQRQIIVAGIEAHVCVTQTVVELLRRGSQVHICWECISGRGAKYRHYAIQRMSQAGAVVTSHESIAFEWLRHKDHPAFKAVNTLLRAGQLGA